MTIPSKHMESPVGARARINGRDVDYFCGTSYFGLHGHPDVIAAAGAAARAYGIGPATGASTPPFVTLVEEARAFFGAETVSCVASGYLGPTVLAQALRADYDIAFADDVSHYSVLDALRATGVPLALFHHLDPNDLAQRLARYARGGKRPLVMTDGVFPTTGALAPLPAYAEVLERYDGGLLAVDDAHAAGVIGQRGRGSFEHFGLSDDRYSFCATLSKAFGGSGGIIPGNSRLAEKVATQSTVPSGASAPPVPALAAAAAGIRCLAAHPEMRQRLHENVRLAHDGFRALGFPFADMPIQILNLAGSPEIDLERVFFALDREDIVVAYVPPHGYSDAPDVESLRIAIFSDHTKEQIARLVDGVRRAL